MLSNYMKLHEQEYSQFTHYYVDTGSYEFFVHIYFCAGNGIKLETIVKQNSCSLFISYIFP